MKTTIKILGKRGRITIPQDIRRELGLVYGDILSFASDGESVNIRRVKICRECVSVPKDSTKELYDFLDELPPDEMRKALLHLTVRWASLQGGVASA
ncbi:MAG: AbrB/MazE/SpoVT family DNA-binding domain-containing protein [Oscillospiraceae bacterium]|nr:AbrB/MazE/SpoVT family DNA-binding domain-containing protein [Oscillospiraceae bacterium]